MAEKKNNISELETAVKNFPKLLDALANMLEALGNFEEKTGKELEELFGPDQIKDFVEKAPPEMTGSFMKLMFELLELSRGMKDMGSLSPQEKKI